MLDQNRLPDLFREPWRLAILGLLALLAWPAAAAFQTEEPTEPAAVEASRSPEGSTSETSSEPQVLRLVLQSAIHPVAAEFIRDALAEADESGAAAVVIELATPGGLETSMREICTAILGAETPVIVYVAPSGSQAASAGFFILLSADVAAMAPGTNAGASAVVGPQGKDIEGKMGEKAQQDAAAYIRSLATRHGRNVELAEKAVLEARSFSAEEALEGDLIDLVVPSLTRLLTEVDGREIEKQGRALRLATADADVRELEMTGFQRFLAVLADPNIAAILLSLGFLGLYFELMNPGAIFPGVIGAICLILGFFALSVLPVNYAGVALIALAIAFFIAEIKVASFGLLTTAGVISLVLGLSMLFKSPEPALRVSLSVIVAMAATSTAVVLFLLFVVVKTFRRQVQTGKEGLIHERGVALSALDPRGKVWIHGEIWHAEAAERVAKGEEIEVVAVDGMRLRVRRLAARPVMAQGVEG